MRLRSKKAHDIKDTKYLLNRLNSKPNKLVADKGYDAEWVHEFCNKKGIKVCIPIREWGKPRFGNLGLRMKSARRFNKRIYHRREMVESVFSALKRKFGVSVSSVKFSAQRAEMYCRAITHNIMGYLFGDFERSLGISVITKLLDIPKQLDIF